MCFLTFYLFPLQRSAGVRGVFSGPRAAASAVMSARRVRQGFRTESKAKFRLIRLSPDRASLELQDGPLLSSWEALFVKNDPDERSSFTATVVIRRG